MDYRVNRHGKPELVDAVEAAGFYFNTSTSEGWHAIATSRTGPVGVDLEAIGRHVNYAQVLRLAASAEELE